MKTHIKLLLLFSILYSSALLAQKATVRGVILDVFDEPIPSVNITFGNTGAISDLDGYYLIEITANENVQITYSHIGHKNVQATLNLSNNEDYELNPVMKTDIEQIATVVISGRENKRVEGITTLSPEAIRRMPSAISGVTSLLTSLPGINSNNELSTQYAVRGGNYDENLVYVNEIEVYRPFLIRSGQQEGLSFVNDDLTSSVDFSAGGFQAKFGDKLSSVLDITYRKPTEVQASLDASLLGVSVSAGDISDDGKFTGIVGLRYRDNSLFVNAKETQTNFKPTFLDAQTYLSYKFNNKLEIGFLGNVAINKYSYKPLTRQTNFGTLADPVALLVFYEGQEEDKYDTYFGALKATYVASQNYTAKFIGSIYQTQEQEYFDILAQYRLGEVDTSIGSENSRRCYL